jgi:putative tryptophan/tyrosine transport system substrate-binding protein
MNRRDAVLALLAFLAVPSAYAQPQGRKVRIGILIQTTRVAGKALIDAFIAQMAEFGWREDTNVEYLFREGGGETARLDALAAELVTAKPDLIYAATAASAQAVKRQSSTIPIIFSFPPDPVASGLVVTLSRPSSNATGTTGRYEGLWGKRLQILREVLPSLRRVAILYDSSDASDAATVEQLQSAGKQLNLEVLPFAASHPEEYKAIFLKMKNQRVGAAILGGSTSNFANRNLIADFAIEHQLPTLAVNTQIVEAGLLMSYGLNLVSMYRYAARYADRILRGVRPQDLPVERPSVLEMVINLKTAKALGLKIPQSILFRADRVIE